MPAPLLERFDPETADVDDFLDHWAAARYIEEIMETIAARAIATAFGADGEA